MCAPTAQPCLRARANTSGVNVPRVVLECANKLWSSLNTCMHILNIEAENLVFGSWPSFAYNQCPSLSLPLKESPGVAKCNDRNEFVQGTYKASKTRIPPHGFKSLFPGDTVILVSARISPPSDVSVKDIHVESGKERNRYVYLHRKTNPQDIINWRIYIKMEYFLIL